MISGVSVGRGPCLQRLAVGLAPDAGEDVEPLLGEVDRGRGADPGRRAGDDDGAAVARLDRRPSSLAARQPGLEPRSRPALSSFALRLVDLRRSSVRIAFASAPLDLLGVVGS